MAKRTKKRTKNRRALLKRVNYQRGRIKDIRADRKRKALSPGKRRSSAGKVYWETRRNRSDRSGGI